MPDCQNYCNDLVNLDDKLNKLEKKEKKKKKEINEIIELNKKKRK